MDVRHKRFITGVILVVAGAAAGGQDGVVFSVSSIKLNTSGLPYSQSSDQPNGVAFVNELLRDVILFAYGIYDFQLADAPDWVPRERFDITARVERTLTVDEKRAGVRRILAERFGLRIRSETREQPLYALVKAGNTLGSGLTSRNCAVPGIAGLACERGIAAADGGVMRMGGIPIARLAAFLGGVLGRVVVDETGLTGPYDVDLQWRPDIGVSPDLTDAARQRIEARPALPAAVREQLGLELRSRRGPVTIHVVESIARPTPD